MSDSFVLGEPSIDMRRVVPSESIVLDQSYYPTVTSAQSVQTTETVKTTETTETTETAEAGKVVDGDEIVPSATSSKLLPRSSDEADEAAVSKQSFTSESVNDYHNIDSSSQSVPNTSQSTNSEIKRVVSNHSIITPDSLTSETLSQTPILRNAVVKVGTHDGRFHADEVMGVTLLKIMYEYLGHKIQLFRTRDQALLDQCDIVLDVGQVYDPNKRRFDHHQKSCNETFLPTNDEKGRILLSSAGMVWKEFGKVIIELYLLSVTQEKSYSIDGSKSAVDNPETYQNTELYAAIIDEAYNQIYQNVVKEIDAHDNGQSMIYEGLDKPELYRFRKHLDLGNTVAKLNSAPSWVASVSSVSSVSSLPSVPKVPVPSVPLANSSNSENRDESSPKAPQTDEEVERKRKEAAEAKNRQFILATEYMESTIRIHVENIIDEVIKINRELPILTKAYNERKLPYLLDVPEHTSSDPKLINRVDKECRLLYSVYYQEHAKVWGFATLQVPGQQFVNRKNLLSMESLKQVLTPDEFSQVVFVHKNLFCGSAKAHDLAIKICRLSAEAPVTDPTPAPTISNVSSVDTCEVSANTQSQIGLKQTNNLDSTSVRGITIPNGKTMIFISSLSLGLAVIGYGIVKMAFSHEH